MSDRLTKFWTRTAKYEAKQMFSTNWPQRDVDAYINMRVSQFRETYETEKSRREAEVLQDREDERVIKEMRRWM